MKVGHFPLPELRYGIRTTVLVHSLFYRHRRTIYVNPSNHHHQLVHSVALLVAEQAAPKNIWAKSLFTAGMTMFSGSIYLLVLDGQTFKPLGPVTPIGGMCLIGGWLALAFASRGRSVAM